MTRNRQRIANVGIGLALLVAASPLSKASPTPFNGLRTVLELIAGKGSGKSLQPGLSVPHGTA